MDEIETSERIDPTRRVLLGSGAMTMVGLNLGTPARADTSPTSAMQESLRQIDSGVLNVGFAAGDVLFIPAGVPHAVKNVGSGDAAEIATYIVEKGKPLLVPTQVSAPGELARQDRSRCSMKDPRVVPVDG